MITPEEYIDKTMKMNCGYRQIPMNEEFIVTKEYLINILQAFSEYINQEQIDQAAHIAAEDKRSNEIDEEETQIMGAPFDEDIYNPSTTP